MIYRLPREIYKSIEKTLCGAGQAYGYKAILSEVNKMVRPIMPITQIKFM